MVKVGTCIAVNLLGDEEEIYFRTEQTREAYGNKYFVFCRMKPLEEISLGDFWNLSEPYFNQLKEEGKLRIVCCELFVEIFVIFNLDITKKFITFTIRSKNES